MELKDKKQSLKITFLLKITAMVYSKGQRKPGMRRLEKFTHVIPFAKRGI